MLKFNAFFIFLLCTVFTSVFASPSCTNTPSCWNGAYISGQAGVSWNKAHAKFLNPNYFNTLGPVEIGSKFDFQSSEWVGGGAIGYHYQVGNIVTGVEIGALKLNFEKKRPSPFFPTIDTFRSELKWVTQAKIRLGYAHKKWLTSITGGWAGGKIDLTLNDNTSNINAHSKKWGNGWTIGIGTDYKISRCLSYGLAYDFIYLKYSHEETACPLCGTGVGFGTPKVSNRLQTQLITLKFNYAY